MTRIAFYAPLKAPTHPTPSGDREMARNLIAMMEHADAEVLLVSDLRLLDRDGDTALQSRLTLQARGEIKRLIADMPEVDLWVTYHNYYKAPDLIGPAVCSARGIPYVQIESTRANKRLTGAWSGFAHATHAACDAADLVFYLTEQDRFALNRDKPATQVLARLPPFLPIKKVPATSADFGSSLLSVGMMREGDKLSSYQVIADTLSYMTTDWHLNIAGDGPARHAVAEMMQPYGDRVTFLGQLDRSALDQTYAQASVFFWPGVNEAFGMVYLEAQAAGLPVVAQNRPGVRDILSPATSYPDVEAGAPALARQLDLLQSDPARWRSASEIARDHVRDHHLITSAANQFLAAIKPLLKGTP